MEIYEYDIYSCCSLLKYGCGFACAPKTYILQLTRRFGYLGQLQSVHQGREGKPAAVAFVDLVDLHRVVHQVILDGNGRGLPVRISVLPQGKETQHLTEKRLKAWMGIVMSNTKYQHLVDNVRLKKCRWFSTKTDLEVEG